MSCQAFPHFITEQEIKAELSDYWRFSKSKNLNVTQAFTTLVVLQKQSCEDGLEILLSILNLSFAVDFCVWCFFELY